MSYEPDVPVSGDTLGGTRDQIRTNFQQIDTVFAKNHYAFGTGDQGKHPFVTTPDQITDSTTLANEPKFYGRITSNAGVLQYSRGGSNAVPTPVTSLHSAGGVVVGAGGTTPVLNYSGMPRAMSMVYAFDSDNISRHCLAYVWWNNTNFGTSTLSGGAGNIGVVISGTTLLLRNNSGDSMTIFWTLDLKRTS